MFVSIISDLGSSSPYLAMAELMIKEQITDAQVIHAAQDLAPFKVIDNTYFLKCAVGIFPSGTFHLILSDVIMALPTQLMLCQHEGNFYLGIDNGILPATFSEEKVSYYIFKDFANSYQEFLSQTCEAIKSILQEEKISEDFFQEFEPKVYKEFPKIIVQENKIECMVIFIDNYGNIVTNLKKEEFEKNRQGRNYEINLTRTETIYKIYDSFSSAGKGEIIAYYNEFGFMQISMRSRDPGHSSSVLGLVVYDNNSYINNTIYIKFK